MKSSAWLALGAIAVLAVVLNLSPGNHLGTATLFSQLIGAAWGFHWLRGRHPAQILLATCGAAAVCSGVGTVTTGFVVMLNNGAASSERTMLSILGFIYPFAVGFLPQAAPSALTTLTLPVVSYGLVAALLWNGWVRLTAR